ncbi:AEC family transporter [Bifidobacterium tibiigranuli]|jgi:predicted permease|uniref:AEC family transporter n=1 Tax=Bifidobacterium tibiigranuli TaxID=2172043 RepID=UPI0026EAB082|nr:AEC family transporter [Bifidobacterium tibiigranuli]MCI1649528.1 permease [Bifidobacterium tibiigranuli]MCI2185012.1 permease [Bifidobacterium tibiigranuli]MCI2203423.1 permease [Bifidobacterium tibiigranuli]
MSAIIQPTTLLLIILAGYLFKRTRLFGPLDYRVLQTAEFNLVLPGAIIYSFATNPHHISLLAISAFSLMAALLPALAIFLTSRHRPVSDRAFLMLNGSGFNVGCFCFPMLQSLLGPAALIPAAMFDIGNSVMVAAGTNVIMQTLLHIEPGKTLTQQHAGAAPTLPYTRPVDRDARRLRRRALRRNVARGFLTSPSFDTYMLMVLLTLIDFKLPAWTATVAQPFASANAFCSMLMVGMLTELPRDSHDVKAVLTVIGWRLPCSLIFAAAAWFLLPFDPLMREAVALCCLAPTAMFSTMFTDKVLGNARLAGFTLSLTAVIAIVMMMGFHFLVGI